MQTSLPPEAHPALGVHRAIGQVLFFGKTLSSAPSRRSSAGASRACRYDQLMKLGWRVLLPASFREHPRHRRPHGRAARLRPRRQSDGRTRRCKVARGRFSQALVAAGHHLAHVLQLDRRHVQVEGSPDAGSSAALGDDRADAAGGTKSTARCRRDPVSTGSAGSLVANRYFVIPNSERDIRMLDRISEEGRLPVESAHRQSRRAHLGDAVVSARRSLAGVGVSMKHFFENTREMIRGNRPDPVTERLDTGITTHLVSRAEASVPRALPRPPSPHAA